MTDKCNIIRKSCGGKAANDKSKQIHPQFHEETGEKH